MWTDPIVEEVRNARDSHARQYNYDLKAIYEALKKEEAMSGRRFIKFLPNRLKEKEVETAKT